MTGRARRIALAAFAAASLAAPGACHAQDTAALAQQPYERGVALYESQQYEPALAQLRASLELYESPNTVLYIARALRHLGRLDEAALDFERARREAGERATREPRYADTARAAAQEIEQLEGSIARLTITTPGLPAGAIVRVGERALPAAALQGLELPVMPGLVRIVAEVDGRAVARREVQLAPGQHAAVEITATGLPVSAPGGLAHATHDDAGPRGRPGGASPVLFWVGLATSALGFGTAAAFWGLALGTLGDLQTHCGPDGPCPDMTVYTDAIARGRTWQTLTDVALGFGIGGGALAVLGLGVSLVASSPARTTAAREAPTRSWRVIGLRVDVARDGFALRGSF